MAANEAVDNTMIKVLEQSKVSPPPGSVPQTLIPLTFLDIPWVVCCPIQRLFFYQIPHPTHHFTHTILPNLKHSLSLTLRRFFPLAATLVLPPPPRECPFLLYQDGASVPLTIAESSIDFNHLVSNGVRDVKDFHPFVPKLSHNSSNNVGNVLALQITLFPNSGICVGVTYNHCIGDGKAITYFLKSWASLCKTPMTSSSDTFLECEPSHNRDLVKVSSGQHESSLESFYTWSFNRRFKEGTDLTRALEGKVRATFVMSRTHINKLKRSVLDQFATNEETQALHASTFVVTCAFTWVHFIKLQKIGEESGLEIDNKICYFPFLADCRNRNVFDIPVPTTYFGNCLEIYMVAMKRSELVGENGFFAAAKAIATKVKELGSVTTLGGVDKYMSAWVEAMENLVGCFSIAGSPNLRTYDIDFGWGRPKKCEMVHIDVSGAVSLTESGHEEGGIEIGVALHEDKMVRFATLFEEGLKAFMN